MLWRHHNVTFSSLVCISFNEISLKWLSFLISRRTAILCLCNSTFTKLQILLHLLHKFAKLWIILYHFIVDNGSITTSKFWKKKVGTYQIKNHSHWIFITNMPEYPSVLINFGKKNVLVTQALTTLKINIGRGHTYFNHKLTSVSLSPKFGDSVSNCW